MRGWVWLGLLAACGGSDGALPEMPQTLAETGFFDSDKVSYEPRYALWADGAEKTRYLAMPEGAAIDVSDMDFWTYPIGIRFWKDFVKDGDLIETRFLWKREEGNWFAMSYVWDDAHETATAAPTGQLDVRGSGHDVPARQDCHICHDRQPDFILGYSAIELDEFGFTIPGNDVERAALGMLHANCGGCHHSRSDVLSASPMILRLSTANLATVAGTEVFTTTVGIVGMTGSGEGVTALIEPGNPAASAVSVRMGIRGNQRQMPPVASNVVDTDGKGALDTWISTL